MSAFDIGRKRGSEYMNRFSLEQLKTITLEEYCAMGRLDARQHFKTKRAQDDYALGWFSHGKQFVSLFKPDDNEQFVAERELKNIRMHLEAAQEGIQKLLQWRQSDLALHTYLEDASDEVEDVSSDIQDVINYLNRPQKRQA